MSVRADTASGRSQRRGRISRTLLREEMLVLVDESGFEGATVSRLAERTGRPASSLYWHFKTKDSLLAEGLQDRFHADLWPASAQGDLLTEVTSALESLVGDGRDGRHVRIGLSLALHPQTPAPLSRQEFLDARARTAAHLRTWWGQALAQLSGRDPSPEAARVMTELSIAALDGRYVTGMGVDIKAANVSLLAQVLVAAALRLTAGEPLPAAVPADTGHLAPAPAGEPGARQKFLHAATEVIGEYGYAGATVNRITDRAGLPASSLYWQFDSREALIAEAVDVAFDAWRRRAGTDRWLDTEDRREELGRSLRRGVRAMHTRPEAFRIGFGLLLSSGRATPRQRFRQIRVDVTEELAGWFTDWLADTAPAAGPAVATETRSGMLAWTVLTMADGLFLVDELTPGGLAHDLIPLLSQALADVAEIIRAGVPRS